MAKKKEMTPEEKLAEALVPADEQPYEVPNNWCWIILGSVVDFERGITFPSSAKEYEKTDDNIFCVRTASIQDELDLDKELYVNTKYLKNNNNKIVRKGDIIFSSANSRELVGKAVIVKNICQRMTFGGFVLNIRTKEPVSNEYVFYYIKLQFLLGNFMGESTQTTNIANINTKQLGTYRVPLPPVFEQKRIVNRIESLFAKLDEAKEKIQRVLDGAELRKSAILHKAFTGELTRKWRQENGIVDDSWEEKRICEVALPRAGFAFDSKKFSTSGYQIIRMGNLYNGEVDLSRNPVFISEQEIDGKVLDRALIKNNDILVTLTGTKYKRDYGYAVRIISPKKLLVNQRILCLSVYDDIIDSSFLEYTLHTKRFRDVFFSNETGGVNQGNVSSKFVESIRIEVPSLAEQQEIVRLLDDLLAKEKSAMAAAEQALTSIDLMKKSILARAFRGQLGTNDPTEESSVELLKEILARN